jgi:hypothetical protein
VCCKRLKNAFDAGKYIPDEKMTRFYNNLETRLVFGVCLFLFISVALGSDNSDDDSSEGDLFVLFLDVIWFL